MDYAASMPMDEEVIFSMEPYYKGVFANPSAFHQEGATARKAVDESRATIARALSTKPEMVYFTSGGTESNCLAVAGTFEKMRSAGMSYKDMHGVTTEIEHPSVLEVFRGYEARGVSVSYIPVHDDGIVRSDDMVNAIQPNTVLVSMMYANNEVGTIQPIRDVGKGIRKGRKGGHGTPYFHSDASQILLFEKISVETLGVDLLSLDAQKLAGPKGIGALFARTQLAPFCRGGSQERGLRPGTQNVPSIVGFAKALEIAEARRDTDNEELRNKQKIFMSALDEISGIRINGSREKRLPNNVNFSHDEIEGAHLTAMLDEHGVAASERSACLMTSGAGSYVLSAMGAKTSGVRLTFGRQTSTRDIEDVADIIRTIIASGA